MSVNEQWRDAYTIAEKMYTENRSMKRTELDILEQIVCARYDSIFSYDPYKDIQPGSEFLYKHMAIEC